MVQPVPAEDAAVDKCKQVACDSWRPFKRYSRKLPPPLLLCLPTCASNHEQAGSQEAGRLSGRRSMQAGTLRRHAGCAGRQAMQDDEQAHRIGRSSWLPPFQVNRRDHSFICGRGPGKKARHKGRHWAQYSQYAPRRHACQPTTPDAPWQSQRP